MSLNRSTLSLQAGAFALVLALAACGGGSSSLSIIGGADCTHPTTMDSHACAYVTLSDAPGDFLTYTVNVTRLELKRSDGVTVEVLSNTPTVDFAQLDQLSEFLTLDSTPPGVYIGGVISLDYTNADIEAEDSSGNAVKLAPVDGNGNAITTLDLTINLDATHPLTLVPGVPHLLNVDFDLDASDTVNSNNTVTVQPFLVASVDPAVGAQLRVRGPLDSVDSANSSFTLGVRPFQTLTGDYGKFAIHTTASTGFIINQKGYVGPGGLSALDVAGPTTAVVAQGQFDFTTHRFVASTVLAGSSVPGGTLDAVEGVVVSRSGNGIVMRGTTLYRAGQSITYRDTVAVMLGSNTVVREADKPLTAKAISDVSVGQHLLVFGTLTSTSPAALDAASGFALLEFTRVDGTVLTTASGDLTMDVQAIQDRPISLFDFTGTGSTATNYDIAFSNGLGSGINVSDPVRAIGFVSPFGSAPPDFTAHTLVDYVNADALISVAWASPGTANAFNGLDATNGIVINLTSSPVLHRLRQGGVVTDLNSLLNAPTIKAPGLGLGVFAVLQNGTVQVYLSFSNFVSAVQARMAGGAKVRGIFALGGFDGTTDVLTSDRVAVVLD
jgi:hypothetical protein